MLAKEILRELQSYIDKNYLSFMPAESAPFMIAETLHNELEDFIEGNRKPAFSETLMKFIDKSGLSDSQVYKKAGIDRRHFSKIRSNAEYKPGKNTVISLALALELDQNETKELLSSAGYSLSKSDLSDLIILFFIERRIYKIDDINYALEYFGLKPIGGAIE